jgi:hypothetical protein
MWLKNEVAKNRKKRQNTAVMMTDIAARFQAPNHLFIYSPSAVKAMWTKYMLAKSTTNLISWNESLQNLKFVPLPSVAYVHYRETDTSSVSSSYSSPPWLGAVKFFRPLFFAFPIISPSSLPLHSGGAWLWGWFSRGRLSISSCGRFKGGSRIEAPSSLFGFVRLPR